MFVISDVFVLLTIFIIIYTTQFYYNHFTRSNPLPGPLPLPIIGNFHQKFRLELNDWLMLMHKKYGDIFEISLRGQRFIVLNNPDLIKNMTVSSTKTKYPFRSHLTEGMIEYGLNGLGITNNNLYKSWKYNRQFFVQSTTTLYFNYQVIEWTIELWEQMESHWNNLGENRKLDLTKWMRRFTNDVIFKIATGTKNDSVFSYYNTLIENNNNLSMKEKRKIEESESFIQSFDTFSNGLMFFLTINKFILHNISFIREEANRLKKNKNRLYERINIIIKQRRNEIKNVPLCQPLRHDMLTSYITVNTPRCVNAIKHADADFLKPMTDKEIFGNILDTILGGTDTTASLFCFIAYYLGHYPEVKQRLQQELEKVFGDLTNPVTSKGLDELKYCDAVIKEVYRHIPTFYSVGRVNIEYDEVGGYYWPEGTSFFMHFSAMMMHKNYWTDPEKFDPDRFYKVGESDKYLLEKKHVKNTFFMWGGGIRTCPGKKLAMIELKCLLASIYRKYDIEMADVNASLRYKSDVVTVIEELIVKIKPRKFQ